MKTLKLSATVIPAFIMTIFFVACKKNNDNVKKPDCRIITATPTPSSAGDPFNISYNTDGKVSSISNGDDVTTFAYSGSTVIATTNTSGTFSSKKIITLNSNGLASNVKTEYNTSGTNWNNDVYEYSGTELVKSTSTSSSGGTPFVTQLTWANDNLVSATSGSDVTTLDYYNKPAQTGDYLYLAQLVAGYQIYKTKNLVKSILSGGTSITNFAYNFDGDGKITSIDVTGASTATYTYQHQCN